MRLKDVCCYSLLVSIFVVVPIFFFILVSPLSDGSPLLNEISVFPPAVLANWVVALGCETVKCHG